MEDNKFLMKYYDTKNMIEKCFYFNKIDRVKKYSYKDSEQLKYNLAGFDDSYDIVCEYYICCKYFKYYLHEDYDFKKVVKMLYDIHAYLNRSTHRNVMTCNIRDVE